MDNQQYNSLTEKLIQNGILSSQENKNDSSNNINNMFGIEPDEDMSHSPFNVNSIKNEIKKEEKPRKRINQYDLELLQNSQQDNSNRHNIAIFDIIKRFLNIKEAMLNNGSGNNLEIFLYKFFPKLYKAKLIKESMSKLLELNIDTKTLLDKTIPYGEGEARYGDLIKYLNFANEIQTRLRKKIN